MSTTTATETLQKALDDANENKLAAALQKMKLGTMLTPVKVVVTGLTAAAAVDITAAATKAAATITGLTLASGQNLPPIRNVTALRVTAVGTGATGPRVITDAGGTAVAPGATGNAGVAGVALLSDDGKTLTFEGTVTGFILQYAPRSDADPTGAFLS